MWLQVAAARATAAAVCVVLAGATLSGATATAAAAGSARPAVAAHAPTSAVARLGASAPVGYSDYQGGALRDGYSADLLPHHLRTAWTYSYGPSATYGYDASTPVIEAGRVFLVLHHIAAPNTQDELVALSARTGKVLWGPNPLQTDYQLGSLAYGDGRLYTNTLGIVQAWSPSTGRLMWTTAAQPDGQVGDGLIVYGQGAVVVETSGQNAALVALDARTGAIDWSRPTAAQNPPSITAGTVLVADNCSVDAYSLATGAPRWQATAPGAPVTCIPQDVVPVLGPYAHVNGVPTGELVDVQTGEVVALDAASTPSYGDAGEFWVIDGVVHGALAAAHPTAWSSRGDSYTGAPVVVNGLVIVSDVDGAVDALSRDNGHVVWHKPTAGSPWRSPSPSRFPQAVAVGDDVLLTFHDGRLRAYTGQGKRPPAPTATGAPPSITVAAPRASSQSSWSGYGGNASHDFDNANQVAGPPYSTAWSKDLGGQASQPVVTAAGTFVIVADATSSTSGSLYGFDTQTGTPLWPPVPLQLGYSGGELTASDGVVVAFDPSTGQSTAVSQASGAVLWTANVGDSGDDDEQASGTHLYVGGAVVDLLTGTVVARRPVAADSPSGYDVVRGDDVYVKSACDGMTRFTDGSLAWQFATDCEGGDQGSPAYEQGSILGQDVSDVIVDHSTSGGAIIDTTSSDDLPASAGNAFYVVDGRRLLAEAGHTHRVSWSLTLQSDISGTPVVAGRTVLVRLDDALYALNAETGRPQWAAAEASPGSPRWEQGPAAAQGVVVLPTATGITVLRGTAASSS